MAGLLTLLCSVRAKLGGFCLPGGGWDPDEGSSHPRSSKGNGSTDSHHHDVLVPAAWAQGASKRLPSTSRWGG